MESAKAVNIAECTDKRLVELGQWLHRDCALSFNSIHPVTGDASFRRYFRLLTNTGTYIAMDAPPPQENCRPFVAVSQALRMHGLHAPDIIAADIDRGYLLITDFGDDTFLKVLRPQNADVLYRKALDALASIQACRDVTGWSVPAFDAGWMWKEWGWHKEWVLEKWLGISFAAQEAALDDCYRLLVESAVTQPQVFMHRDYHSANLMLLPDQQAGILDFQDAFIGPLTYDVVSLLRDCYIDWPDEKVMEWAACYFQLLVGCSVLHQEDWPHYQRWFDWMGMQRHLKALLTFARKHVRDHHSDYLRHVPRTLNYLITVSARYPEMAVLHRFLVDTVQPASQKELTQCAQ